MGIVNVTPDSFSDGGEYLDRRAAIARGRQLVDEGADLVDVGGESTRPGAMPVDEDLESERVIPVVEALTGSGVAVSVDTSKAVVARRALAAGAEVINDITALGDPAMAAEVASAGAGVVLMHMQGTPRTMQEHPRYRDVVEEVTAFLAERAGAAEAAGIDREGICVDPGIGFGKNLEHNLTLIRHLPHLAGLGYPVLIGASRKSFLGRLSGQEEPAGRDLASAVTAALAVERGADVIRVHNVPVCREAVAVALAIVRGSGG
jgi:dihydropteroate synthase